ncbi:hypothetical protein BAE44_0003267, partial [Dichanthelium oligosanthes]
LHRRITKAMKLGLIVVTVHVRRNFFGGLAQKLIMDFDGLRSLYRRKRLEVQLIDVWCL